MNCGCRFIAGDDFLDRIRKGEGFDTLYCGQPVITPGGSWCQTHHEIVWVKPWRKRAVDPLAMSREQRDYYVKLRRSGFSNDAALVEAMKLGEAA